MRKENALFHLNVERRLFSCMYHVNQMDNIVSNMHFVLPLFAFVGIDRIEDVSVVVFILHNC